MAGQDADAAATYRHGCGGTCGQELPRRCPARVGGITEMEPKTEPGKRGIGLPPQLLADLRAHRQVQLVERLAAGLEWQDYEPRLLSAQW